MEFQNSILPLKQELSWQKPPESTFSEFWNPKHEQRNEDANCEILIREIMAVSLTNLLPTPQITNSAVVMGTPAHILMWLSGTRNGNTGFVFKEGLSCVLTYPVTAWGISQGLDFVMPNSKLSQGGTSKSLKSKCITCSHLGKMITNGGGGRQTK